jgi:hypothetical protein
MPAVKVKTHKRTVRKVKPRLNGLGKLPASNGKKPISESYDRYKFFEGKQYTGMQIGRSHKWHYDKGEWRDRKITPDLWEIYYEVKKRRVGKAPKGSGAKIGTGYHWYILAHQRVVKLNEDVYSTAMSGLKLKLAHHRADKDKWSASAAAQRRNLVKFLKQMITQLEKEPVPIQFEYKGKTYKGEGIPIPEACHDGVCFELDVSLNNGPVGTLHRMKSGWKMDGVTDQKLVDMIGEAVQLWYE